MIEADAPVEKLYERANAFCLYPISEAFAYLIQSTLSDPVNVTSMQHKHKDLAPGFELVYY